jgi:hypothetical protein
MCSPRKGRFGGVVRLMALAVLALNPTFATVSAGETIAVKFKHNTTLVEDGQALRVMVQVRCAPSRQPLGSLVYVIQEENTSAVAGVPITCDNHWHTQVVTATTFQDTPLYGGDAHGSTYMLLYDPDSSEMWQGQDS